MSAAAVRKCLVNDRNSVARNSWKTAQLRHCHCGLQRNTVRFVREGGSARLILRYIGQRSREPLTLRHDGLCNRCRFPVVYPVIWNSLGQVSQRISQSFVAFLFPLELSKQVRLAIGIRSGLCKQKSKSEVEERAWIGSRPAGYQPPS